MPVQNTSANVARKLDSVIQGHLNGHLSRRFNENKSILTYSSNPITTFGAYLLTGPVWCPSNQKLYFNQNNGNIRAFDPLTNTIAATISVSSLSANNGMYCPSNNRLYYTQYSTNGLYVINPITNTNVATITTGTLDNTSATYCSRSDKIYIGSAGSLKVIDPSTNTVVATISIGGALQGICHSTVSGLLYVTTYNASSTNDIYVVDPTTNSVLKSFSSRGLTSRSYALRNSSYCSANNKIYGPDNTGSTNAVIIIDCNTDTAKPLSVPLPQAGATLYTIYHPTRNLIYTTSELSGTNIYVIDPITDSVIGSIPLNAYDTIGYCPLNDLMYVQHNSNGNVYVF